MKRLSLALAAIGFSAGAFAALPAATDPTLVAIPQLPGGFVIGGTAFYLQPSDTNGDLDYASINTGTSPNFGSSLKNVEPGYDWGWGVNVGYIFPDTGNDVNLSYFQLDTQDTNSDALALFGGGFASPIPFIISDPAGSLGGAIRDVSAKAEYDINQVDLTAGQFVDVGCRLVLHPFAGLRWAQLERKLNSGYTVPSTGAINAGYLTIAEKSDFSGIGPLVGIDASYYVANGFGFVGHFDSALLVGNIDATTNATAVIAQSVPAPVAYGFKADDTNRVVPVMDGKLGADYTFVFNNTSNSDMTLEIGWQVSNYFNAVDRLTVASDGVGVSSGNIVRRTTSDVGLSGPYASLVFHI